MPQISPPHTNRQLVFPRIPSRHEALCTVRHPVCLPQLPWQNPSRDRSGEHGWETVTPEKTHSAWPPKRPNECLEQVAVYLESITIVDA